MMKKILNIGDRRVGDGEPVFIIAEAGVNHNGDMNLAKKLIDAAIDAGADAVKFQSYKTEKIITPSAPAAEYHIRASDRDESWFQLLKRLELAEDDHQNILSYCQKGGIIFLSTPYDEESADFLNSINMPAFKIASTDMNNIPLLQHVARYQKPILLSTGMSTMEEIGESVEAVRGEGNLQIILLQCTANYPPSPEDANLNVIATLRLEFELLVGYSDHLACSQAAIAAVAKGICLYEAHFTLDRNMPGPDQKSSLEPQELKQIIKDIRLTQKLLGSSTKKITPSEQETRTKLRKSIVAVQDIKLGDRFTQDNIGIKRPGVGLTPSQYFKLLGKKVKRNIAKDELIQLTDCD